MAIVTAIAADFESLDLARFKQIESHHDQRSGVIRSTDHPGRLMKNRAGGGHIGVASENSDDTFVQSQLPTGHLQSRSTSHRIDGVFERPQDINVRRPNGNRHRYTKGNSQNSKNGADGPFHKVTSADDTKRFNHSSALDETA